ncbi:MAG: glycosyltransferase family 4 protein, partial [Burkholderiales bacterium]
MDAKRQALVLMTADTVGGVWHYAVELAGALGAHGVRVALATMGASLTRLQREQIARVPSASVYDSPYKLEWMPEPWHDVARAGAWLLRLEHKLRPDVIHLNQFAFGALPFDAPALIVAHSCVISWWRAVHGTSAPRDLDRYRSAVRHGLNCAALVGAPTGAMLRTLRSNYAYKVQGVVLPNGRSAVRFARGTKQPLILTAGRLWDCAKNLAALEAVAPQLPWPVLVAGPSSQPGGGIRESRGVRALGDLAPERLAREFARAAIYALPARYEPFGLSVLEAALSGCALVLGDVPSLREVWGSTALYVKPDDHAGLHATLCRLISDERLRERLARTSRQRALTYTPERMARSYLEAYSTVLKS